jgi:hypothetical protein
MKKQPTHTPTLGESLDHYGEAYCAEAIHAYVTTHAALQAENAELKKINEELLDGMRAILELDLSSAHDMKRIKYTDDEVVGYCEAQVIAKQALTRPSEVK